MKALIALEDGKIFPCRSFTGPGEVTAEVVFNTSMTGYQEVLTDPSYRGQMVTMTYPLVGNYGINPEDVESAKIQVSAFLIKEYQEFPSNYRATATLKEYLMAQGIMGVEDLDTRALTRHIRNGGAMRAALSTTDLNPSSLVTKAQMAPSMAGQDLANVVTCEKPYRWTNNTVEDIDLSSQPLDQTIWRKRNDYFSVIAIDFGIKYNILRCLSQLPAEVIVVPAQTDAQTIKAMAPEGIFFSNGPGDPEPVTYGADTARTLIAQQHPMFGICLGHQIIAQALGAKTYKLKFGHRGANQPVKNLLTGKVEITSQNHGFAVDIDSLADKDIEITHINLNDNTVEGFRHRHYPLYAVQYHPEASPGPHDANYLFAQFKEMMLARRKQQCL
jgi:carbamoyl-phosphate synthase small subunit